MSLGSFAALCETRSTHTKAHMCSHLKMCSHFPYTHSLSPSLSLSPFYTFAYLCLLFSISLSSHPFPTLTLSSRLLLRLSFSILPHSFRPPSVTPLFRSLRKSHSLIWDMLDLVSLKSHFTNSLSASPEKSAGYLKQFHHSPGFVRWNDASMGKFLLPIVF